MKRKDWNTMPLSKHNIKKWLKKVDVESNRFFGNDKMSETLSKEDLLDEWEGLTVGYFVEQEIQACL